MADERTRTEGARPPSVVLHEERLSLGAQPMHAGTVRIDKTVQAAGGLVYIPRLAEDPDTERVPAQEGDSGEVETLEDGSLSIPILEEELVVTKRVVVRERLIVRKRVTTTQEPIRADLRHERAEIQADGDAQVVEVQREGEGRPRPQLRRPMKQPPGGNRGVVL